MLFKIILYFCMRDAFHFRCNPGLRNALKLDKSQMHQMIVIGQVDKKFISVYMGEPSVSSKMLFMFDQHAVHERIRLEDLIKGKTYSKLICTK